MHLANVMVAVVKRDDVAPVAGCESTAEAPQFTVRDGQVEYLYVRVRDTLAEPRLGPSWSERSAILEIRDSRDPSECTAPPHPTAHSPQFAFFAHPTSYIINTT